MSTQANPSRTPMLDALDAIDDDAAIELARSEPSRDPADARWARALHDRLMREVAAQRHAMLRDAPAPREARTPRVALRQADRPGLLAWLGAIIAARPSVRIAYRNVTELTDDDLRQTIELLLDPEE